MELFTNSGAFESNRDLPDVYLSLSQSISICYSSSNTIHKGMCPISVCLYLGLSVSNLYSSYVGTCLSLSLSITLCLSVFSQFLPITLTNTHSLSCILLCVAQASLLAIFTTHVNRYRAAALNLVSGWGNGTQGKQQQPENAEKWHEMTENT